MALVVRTVGLDDRTLVVQVAARMRWTLDEVLGADRTVANYDDAWLMDRVDAHLDPARLDGAVIVALDDGGSVVGQTIVRPDVHDGCPTGLFSTTWVAPAHRRAGLAHQLLDRGEAWLAARGLMHVVTDTSSTNTPLLRLFSSRGYTIVVRSADGAMVRLLGNLSGARGS
jgi:GNAT superfamily N-acetyltransferase